jgi:adenine-specific DNA-methyltransferase
VYLIEAVTSHGPVTPKRYIELERMFADCTADRVYVTVFPSAAEFCRFAADIAWETEVWLRESPDHMIHFNGQKFVGPYKTQKTE